MDNLLVARLLATSALTAIVGANIKPVMPPEDPALPYLYYWRLDTQDTLTMSGPTRPKSYTYGIDYWSLTQSQCRAIAEAVYATLTTWRDASIQGCFLQSDGMQEQGEPLVFHGQQTFLIWS